MTLARFHRRLTAIAHCLVTWCHFIYLKNTVDQPTSANTGRPRVVVPHQFLIVPPTSVRPFRGCADVRVVFSGPPEAVRERVCSRLSSVVRPRVPDWSDHVRGRRVIRASLLHVVHQRAVLALVRVEARLLTTCHAAPIAWVHLLQVVQGLA